MKKWAVALACVSALCALVFAARSDSPRLLKDTDTAVLLRNVESRHAPLSWFAGDWPLGNHFYRPISTLLFEADHALYGWNPTGYGVTNALLAIGCILMLFWLVRELTDSPLAAGSAATVFALWHLQLRLFDVAIDCLSWAVFAVALGALLPGRRLVPNLLAMLVAGAAVSELCGVTAFSETILYWVPGRTASTMALFALAAMAAYARYERLGASRVERAPDILAPPATKSARAPVAQSGRPALWAVAACAFAALALGSYEQAVMLPAALLGVAAAMRMLGFRVRWAWQGAFWGLLVGYLALRHAVVPTGFSGYQLQQFRSGAGLWLSLADMTFPCLAYAPGLYIDATTLGWAALLFSRTYQIVLIAANDVAVVITARRKLPLVLLGWIVSILAFLPMAWLSPFGHYYYWPMAIRTILVVALFSLTGSLIVTGWSRPALQAPPRSGPAPGSLPRP